MFRFRSVTLLAAALTLMLVALSGPVAAGSPFVENYQDKGRAGLAGNGDCTFGPGGDESCYFVDVFAQLQAWPGCFCEIIKADFKQIRELIDHMVPPLIFRNIIIHKLFQ